MKTLKRLTSCEIPSSFIEIGKGYWYYTFDVQPEKVSELNPLQENNETNKVNYSFCRIKIAGKPTYKRCVEAIIRELLTQSQEFDIINSYNRAMLGTLSEEDAEKAKADYLEYLQTLDRIKSIVKKDFKSNNIK